MRKITLIVALIMGMIASVDAEKRLTFENYDFCVGGVFNKVSNNGKYVAGYTDAGMGGNNTGFVYLVEVWIIILRFLCKLEVWNWILKRLVCGNA